jgi:hypothetical protein
MRRANRLSDCEYVPYCVVNRHNFSKVDSLFVLNDLI